MLRPAARTGARHRLITQANSNNSTPRRRGAVFFCFDRASLPPYPPSAIVLTNELCDYCFAVRPDNPVYPRGIRRFAAVFFRWRRRGIRLCRQLRFSRSHPKRIRKVPIHRNDRHDHPFCRFVHPRLRALKHSLRITRGHRASLQRIGISAINLLLS